MSSGNGYYITERDNKRKIKDYISILIYDYLLDRAVFVPRNLEAEGEEIKLQKGQYFSSADKIFDYLEKIGVSTSLKTVKRRIADLQDLEVISSEPVKKGKKSLGSIFTIKNSSADPLPALQPQGIQPQPDPYKSNFDPLSDPYNDPQSDPLRALQPQGFQRTRDPLCDPLSDPLSDPPIINNKDLNNNVLRINKDKDIKEAAKIAQPLSIVNTFSTAFNFILQKFENELLTDRLEATKAQIDALRSFVGTMDTELIVALMQEAGEGTQKNPAAYFIKICRENMQKGITTLDKRTQSAAQYRYGENNGRQQQKKDTSNFATRRGLAVPDSYYDDLPF